MAEEEIPATWTPERLQAYRRNREKAQYDKIFRRPHKKPVVANSKYNPLRWRG